MNYSSFATGEYPTLSVICRLQMKAHPELNRQRTTAFLTPTDISKIVNLSCLLPRRGFHTKLADGCILGELFTPVSAGQMFGVRRWKRDLVVVGDEEGVSCLPAAVCEAVGP